MIYTTEQAHEMAQAKLEMDRTGNPSAVQRINLAIENQLAFKEIQKIYKVAKVKPEKELPIEVTYDHPPLTGKGSGNNPWRRFAKTVSDMDPDIIDSMGRDDIIKILRDKGVIDE